MAIFEHVQVRVVGAGTPLYEYDDPANDYDQTLVKQDNVVIEKHVESTPGSNFEIEIMIKPGFKYSKYVNCDALRASAYVDGTLMGRPLLLEKDYVQEPKGLRLLIEGKKVLVEGVWQLLKFRFQALQTYDDGTDAPEHIHEIAQLGTIKVTIDRRKRLGKGSAGKQSGSKPGISTKISEKIIKGRAKDAITTLDDAVEAVGRHFARTRSSHSLPLVTFIFHYSTRAGLQNLGIIERPRSPTPLEQRDPSTLSAAELLERLRRQGEIIQSQEEAAKVLKKQLRRSKNQNNLRKLDAMKRGRSRSPIAGDDELQEIKRPRKEQSTTYIDLIDD